MLTDVTAASQVRFSELTPKTKVEDLLIQIDVIKTFFGVKDTSLDVQLTLAAGIVTSAIRTYTGRYLSFGEYQEVFTDVSDQKPERYLIETPIRELYPNVTVPSPQADLLNANTGRIVMTAGPVVEVHYQGGYETLPADLVGVFLELIRQQMAIWGVITLGNMSSTTPIEKSVTVGSLRVEYAVTGATPMARATAGGPLTVDGLIPYAGVLDAYVSYRRLVAA